MRILLITAAATLLSVGGAAAQTGDVVPPLSRGDVHAIIGWQNLRQERGDDALDSYNNWANGIFYGGAGAGWYWTDHLKTQVDLGTGSRARHYFYRTRVIDGQVAGETGDLTIQQRSVALSQQYQFFRNQWFHPHVA